MMRKLILAGIAMMTIAISSCDEDTTTLGDSLTNGVDKFVSISETFQVETQSIMSGSVLATSLYNYLGKIKDPETGAYITSDYMTQFNILENESAALFPALDQIAKDASGLPIADSCVIRIMVNSCQGDSLAAMKLQLCELEKPVPNSSKYYSDFNLEEEGYLRTTNGIKQNKTYSVSDLTMSDSLRNVLRGSSYYQYITIPLSKAYTDRNNNTYPGYNADDKGGTGYGTYLLRMYYDHPEYFKNSNTFSRNVCPGFYVKSTDGLGAMLEVANTQLLVYFHYDSNGTTVNSSRAFTSTSEVLQTNHITNDKDKIQALVDDSTSCTYLKTPAGIFTEVALPIDSIKWLTKTIDGVTRPSHLNDTIMMAKITFQQIKSQSTLSSKLLEEPSQLLMVPRDKLYSFFESNTIPDNITSFIATYNSVQKSYTFNTLSSLVNYMYNTMKPHITNADGSINLDKVEAYKVANPNWNKVVLVPVDMTMTYTNSGSTSVSAVYNSMAISSVRLVGGKDNKHSPVTITMMYSKNE